MGAALLHLPYPQYQPSDKLFMVFSMVCADTGTFLALPSSCTDLVDKNIACTSMDQRICIHGLGKNGV